MIHNSFHYISNKIINPNNNPLSNHYDITDPVQPIVKTFFAHFITCPQAYKNKFYFLYETHNSFFLLPHYKSHFLDLFCKVQKTYHSFQRLAYLFKYKKAKTVVTTDMALNEINENQKNIMCIFHNRSKYLFRIQDLIQIINAALTQSYNFFAEPIHIKNPFNNLPFDKSTLYNIYFYIKFNTILYPELVFKFFQVNFDLSYFLYYNEPLLREYAIKDYATKSPNNILYKDIMNMLTIFNEQYKKDDDKIIIDSNFPKDRLIKVMKPYILLYFNITYSLTPIVKEQSKRELIYKLKKFQQFNPRFGQKKIIFNHVCDKRDNHHNYTRIKIDFNFAHIPFQDTSDFATSHLEVTTSKIYHFEEENHHIFNNHEQDEPYYSSDDSTDDTSDTDHENHYLYTARNFEQDLDSVS